MYLLGMNREISETSEHLTRVMAPRRGRPVERIVHYEKSLVKGCNTYRLILVEDAEPGTRMVELTNVNALH